MMVYGGFRPAAWPEVLLVEIQQHVLLLLPGRLVECAKRLVQQQTSA